MIDPLIKPTLRNIISGNHTPPWAQDPQISFEYFEDFILDDVIKKACEELGLKNRHVPEEYVFQTYTNCFIFDPDTNASNKPEDYHYTGLALLFRHNTEYFVASEQSKSWSLRGSGGHIEVSSERVDNIKTQHVKKIANTIIPKLEQQGFIRLKKSDLAAKLPKDLALRITDGQSAQHMTYFDGLFWVRY